MPAPSPIDASILGYGSVEPDTVVGTTASEDANRSESNTHSEVQDSKTSLRKLMVSCIDSALEELGPLGDLSKELQNSKPVLPPPSISSSSLPTAEQLYGYGPASPKVCPELQLRGRIRRGPRYQRRNSVTKFSLSSVLQQVQKDDLEGKLKPVNPLFQRLYKGDSLKRAALNNFPKTTLHQALAVEGPAAKRRRACL